MSGRATLLQLFRYKREIGGEDEGEITSPAPPPNYDEGPHPLISGTTRLDYYVIGLGRVWSSVKYL